MAEADDNSRDFFRVSCRVLLGCRDTNLGKVPGTSADSYFPDSSHLNLLRELGRIEHESSHLLHAVAESDRNLSAYLSVINRKIDTIARHLVSQLPAEMAGTEQEVSLSEGGLSFHASQALEAGTIVAMHITLLPTYIGLASFARVVNVEPEDGAYRVSTSFENLSEGDRQLIAKHVMQVQLAYQRKRVLKE